MTSPERYIGLISCIALTSFFGWLICFIATPMKDPDDYDTNGVGNLIVVIFWALAVTAYVVHYGLTHYGQVYATWTVVIITGQLLGAIAVRLMRKYDVEERLFWRIQRF